MEFKILKYPRTQHLKGSRLQEGDEDLRQVPFSEILGKHIVIEEKIDGANSAISFNDKQELLLQSRGHYLNGGYNDLKATWSKVDRAVGYKVDYKKGSNNYGYAKDYTNTRVRTLVPAT